MDRRDIVRIGLCVALVASVVRIGLEAADAEAYGEGGGSSTPVTTILKTTDDGADFGIGGQGVIPTSGRNAHRGKGAPEITCKFETLNVADPLGGRGDDAGNPYDLHVGTQVWRSCYSTTTGARVEGPTLYTTTERTPGRPAVTDELIDMALANIDIDLPVPQFSPPGQTFPNFDTWLWTADLPTQTASATAAGVTITVTAKLTTIRYGINAVAGAPSRDDEVVITCAGAPKAYDASRPDRDQSTSCHHRFSSPTRDLTIDTTATWQLTWTATNGTDGDLGTIDRITTTPYRVQEKRTVIRSGA